MTPHDPSSPSTPHQDTDCETAAQHIARCSGFSFSRFQFTKFESCDYVGELRAITVRRRRKWRSAPDSAQNRIVEGGVAGRFRDFYAIERPVRTDGKLDIGAEVIRSSGECPGILHLLLDGVEVEQILRVGEGAHAARPRTDAKAAACGVCIRGYFTSGASIVR